MDNENQNQNQNKDRSQQQYSSNSNDRAIGSQRIIQPSSDLVEEIRVLREQQDSSSDQLRPQLDHQPVQISSADESPDNNFRPSVDMSKLYPSASTTPVSDASTSVDPEILAQKSIPSKKYRVASIVPALRNYAILILVAAGISALGSSGIFLTLRSSTGAVALPSGLAQLLTVLAVSIAFIVIVGVYLLITRSFRVVSAVLTGLLIINALGVLGSLFNLVVFISYINAGTIVSLLISIGLLMYVFNVRSQVKSAMKYQQS